MDGNTTAEWKSSRDLAGSVRSLSVGTVPGLGVPASSSIRTGAASPIMLTTAGLTGDEHSSDDLDEAVSAYPWENYWFWADTLGRPLDEPSFGENLTVTGLLEDRVFVGDSFQWGKAVVQVTGPWRPDTCRLNDLGAASLGTRTGFTFRVLNTGRVGPDDRLELIDVDPFGVSVAAVSTAAAEGVETAGLTTERLLLARHVLARHWVELLDARTVADHDLGGARLTGTNG